MIPSTMAHRVITVHDLYFYVHPEHTRREIRRDYSTLVKKHCEESDAIIAISDYTRQKLIDLLGIAPTRIYTIRHGVNETFAAPIPQDELDRVRGKYGIDRPFFLYVGTREPRKNLSSLLKAHAALERDSALVIVGPADGHPLDSSRVIETGYISQRDLCALYRQAIALVVPSLDEGFGMTVLEAMRAGAPVVASLIPAIKEIANHSFLPLEPEKVESIIEALKRIRDDSALRRTLIESGLERAQRFQWSDAARKTLELYQNL
jgi:glycosyltransferase involved in cell wall biosynthesis